MISTEEFAARIATVREAERTRRAAEAAANREADHETATLRADLEALLDEGGYPRPSYIHGNQMQVYDLEAAPVITGPIPDVLRALVGPAA